MTEIRDQEGGASRAVGGRLLISDLCPLTSATHAPKLHDCRSQDQDAQTIAAISGVSLTSDI